MIIQLSCTHPQKRNLRVCPFTFDMRMMLVNKSRTGQVNTGQPETVLARVRTLWMVAVVVWIGWRVSIGKRILDVHWSILSKQKLFLDLCSQSRPRSFKLQEITVVWLFRCSMTIALGCSMIDHPAKRDKLSVRTVSYSGSDQIKLKNGFLLHAL